MKKQAHIYIFGTIGQGGDIFSMEPTVSLKDVVDVINANPGAEEFITHINSKGGDVNEGFAMHDALRATGKKIITRVEGLCYSIATIVAMAGDDREIYPNSRFGIHNPWGGIEGEGDDIIKYGERVKEYENRILDFYVKKTGGDKATLQALMKDDTEMSADKALELKFITKIVDQVKAFAKISSNSTQTNTMFEKIKSSMDELTKSIQAALKDKGIKAMLTLTTEDGTQTIEVQTDASDPAVGDVCTVNGAPAPDGSYKLKDGRTIMTKAGKIDSITPAPAAAAATPPPPAAAAGTETIESLTAALAQQKKDFDALQAKFTAQEAINNTNKTALDEVTKNFELIKNLTSNFIPKKRALPAGSAAAEGEEEKKTPKTPEEVKAELRARDAKRSGKPVTAATT